MNAGLSNLATLRGFVLPTKLAARTDFDDKLVAIGFGVLAMLEARCNRKFVRVVDETVTISADRTFFYLPRTPVEGVDDSFDGLTAELLYVGSTDWINQADRIARVDGDSGLVEFLVMAGTRWERLRFTWTGGYWFPTAEPGATPDVQPEGSTALPDALRSAWLLQCQEVFERSEHVVSAVLPGGGESNLKLNEAKLLPAVEDMLRPFVRYQLL